MYDKPFQYEYLDKVVMFLTGQINVHDNFLILTYINNQRMKNIPNSLFTTRNYSTQFARAISHYSSMHAGVANMYI